MNLFDKMEPIRIIAGDTIPTIHITVEEMGESDSMECRIFGVQQRMIVVAKECIQTDTGFSVNITDEETSIMPVGKYFIEFVLITGGHEYKRLRGLLIVVEG